MTGRELALICVGVSLAVSIGGCGTSSGSSGDAGPVGLLQSRCQTCHGSERINGAKHDLAGWQETIARMRGRGAKLTDQEASTLASYLASREAPAPSTPPSGTVPAPGSATP